MKVYVRGTGSGFEQSVARALARLDQIDGCVLVGFSYGNSQSKDKREIDGVFVSRRGVVCCLEAKGYTGVWRGSENSAWTADGNTIKSSGKTEDVSSGNPFLQVQPYACLIKDLLGEELFPGSQPWVNTLIVVPDNTRIEIEDAHINEIGWGKTINICQLSRLGAVLKQLDDQRSAKAWRLRAELDRIGLEAAMARLVKLSQPEFSTLLSTPEKPILKSAPGSQTLAAAVSASPRRPSTPHSPIPAQKVTPLSHRSTQKRQTRPARLAWPLAASFLAGALSLGGILQIQDQFLGEGQSQLGSMVLDLFPKSILDTLSTWVAPEPSSSPEVIRGRTRGWERKSVTQVQFRLEAESGQTYQLQIDLSTLSQIPNCIAPTPCNHRQVEITSVSPIQDPSGVMRLEISDPQQMKVIES